jgi:osmotically-inducible protein OsmY
MSGAKKFFTPDQPTGSRHMMRKFGTLAGAFLGVALMAATCTAQEPKAKGSSVSEKVDSAVQSLKKGAHEASEAIRDQYNKMRTSVHNMGVAGRVYGRLHWDKALADAKVEVEVRKDGVAVLTGTVPDTRAKTKAVDLTRDTVGVTQVLDQLTVGTGTSTTTETTTTTTTTKKP